MRDDRSMVRQADGHDRSDDDRTGEPSRAELSAATTSGSGRELDRRGRMERILERDGASCVWCRRPVGVGLVEATTEHVVPRIKGGPSWIENEVAACRRCNGARGHLTPAEWIAECEAHGWEPDRDTIVRVLKSLQAAIAERGGRRRARPYIVGQLRRLDPDHRARRRRATRGPR
jgi:hypothetical protein